MLLCSIKTTSPCTQQIHSSDIFLSHISQGKNCTKYNLQNVQTLFTNPLLAFACKCKCKSLQEELGEKRSANCNEAYLVWDTPCSLGLTQSAAVANSSSESTLSSTGKATSTLPYSTSSANKNIIIFLICPRPYDYERKQFTHLITIRCMKNSPRSSKYTTTQLRDLGKTCLGLSAASNHLISHEVVWQSIPCSTNWVLLSQHHVMCVSQDL